MAIINVSLPSDGQTIDASDYNTPITTIVNEINGGLDNDNIASGAAITGSKIADNSLDLGAKASTWDGWIEVSDSWTYASTTTVTVPTDATTKYSVGDKVKFTNSTLKYFTVTAVAATTLTLVGQTTETVANAAISGISYSHLRSPVGDNSPFTPVAFRGTTTQSIPDSASFSDITTYTEVFDTGSNFVHTTGVFTAPKTGLYYLSLNVGFNDPSTGSRRFGCKITASSAIVAEAYVSATQTNHDPYIVASTVCKMSANDTAICAAYQDTGGAEALNGTSHFCGYFIGSA